MGIAKINELSIGIELYLSLHFIFQLHACGVDLLQYLNLRSVVFDGLPINLRKLRECVLEFAEANLDLYLLKFLFDLPSRIDVLVNFGRFLYGLINIWCHDFLFETTLDGRKEVWKLAYDYRL